MPKNSKKTKKKMLKKKKKTSDKKKAEKHNVSETETSTDYSSEYEWTEKSPSCQREEWMSKSPRIVTHSKFVPTDENSREKGDHSRHESSLQPGRSDRELNPYWKHGGCGLPICDDQSEIQNIRQVTNIDWLQKTVEQRNSSETTPTSNYMPAGKSALKPDPHSDGMGKVNTLFENYISAGNHGWRKGTKLETDAANLDRSADEPKNTGENDLLTEAEMNSLASRILKAKLTKNEDLVKKLSAKLAKARKFCEDKKQGTAAADRIVLLTSTNARGATLPMRGTTDTRKRKNKKYETHVDGERVRYFEDDDKYSLMQMYEKEMSRSTADHNAEFLKLFAKKKKSEDFSVEDLLMEQTTPNKSYEDKDMQSAISRQKRTERALDSCLWCLSNEKIQKHLIVSTRSKCYLSLPYFQPLTEGHCIIAPIYHSTCSTLVDEDVWEEVLVYCKNLTNVFRARNKDLLFFETAMNFEQYPHMRIHCVPIPFEIGSLAPIYFKKAILESEKEWSQNKKLIDVNKFNVKRVIPQGLPYFTVNFGLDYGFAHVIEDENDFPTNFAQEVIGGMLEIDQYIWRKPRIDDFENQCKRVNSFKRMCGGAELLDS